MMYEPGAMTLENFMEGLEKRNPNEPEFHQAVREVAEVVIPYINENPKYIEARILERMTEPDRTIIFRVCWEDDKHQIRVNRGYRVQFNNAIGPYKGGLRFHPSVNLSILKFLGFEQTFKNSLTQLPMGAGKGGADFNPKEKSEQEIMRFCQSFMTELSKHIGKDVDVPAGDIGVGAREISFMFGQYKRLRNEFTGALTGKGLEFGGSLVRKEATGFGCVYFMEEMLKSKNDSVANKKCLVSGSGNVALYASQKLINIGAKVITLSDSSGFVHVPDGIDREQLDFVIDLKVNRQGRLSEAAEHFNWEYHPDKKPWGVPADLAFPCATQNEIDDEDADLIIKNKIEAIAEGANMPTFASAVKKIQNAGILFAPGKASNAGGVAVSGLEMSQNSLRMAWEHDDIDLKLRNIMSDIHRRCVEFGKVGETIDYVKGANIAGFKKVADAMLAYGVV